MPVGVLDDAVRFQARDFHRIREAGCQTCHQLFIPRRDTITKRPPENSDETSRIPSDGEHSMRSSAVKVKRLRRRASIGHACYYMRVDSDEVPLGAILGILIDASATRTGS